MANKAFGPKTADHPSIGQLCPICQKPFKEGDMTTLQEVAPANEEELAKMRTGRPYTAEAREIHYHSCYQEP